MCLHDEASGLFGLQDVAICVQMCCMSSLQDVWLAVGMFVLSPVRRCVCVCVMGVGFVWWGSMTFD